MKQKASKKKSVGGKRKAGPKRTNDKKTVSRTNARAQNKELENDRLAGVKAKLIEMRRQLLKDSKSEIGKLLGEGDKYLGVSDDGDLSDMSNMDAMVAATTTRYHSQLKAVDEALRKIEDGTYGRCEDCGEEIPVGRLKALPFAARCVECQERHELMGLTAEALS